MKKIFLIAIAFAIMANIAVAAIDIQITPAKAAFNEGDTVAFDYIIASGTAQNIVFVPHISCPAMPVAILEQKRANLQAGMPFRGSYYGSKVNTGTLQQECTASIEVGNPAKAKKEAKLKINALPALDLFLNACKDNACTKKQRTFVKGENVYLKASSKVSASATASITFPDKTAKTIALPGSFAATQPGEYIVEYTATKSGYKQAKGTASIFVIERAFTVQYADFSSKVGQAVIRPVFKAPSALAASNTATKAPAATAKKSSIKSFFTRVTGYFTAIF